MTLESLKLSTIKDVTVLRDQVRTNQKLLERAQGHTSVFRGAFFITMGMLLWALHQNGMLPFVP